MTVRSMSCCLSSCSYIKPQRWSFCLSWSCCCLSSCSYIKPQQTFRFVNGMGSCLSSCSYIKPQRSLQISSFHYVVYHLVPTSNHNRTRIHDWNKELFIILFLHQTTTVNGATRTQCPLFIILFLHQTTTELDDGGRRPGCLSSCSYIKPQPIVVNLLVISKILRFGLLRNGRAGRFLLQIY